MQGSEESIDGSPSPRKGTENEWKNQNLIKDRGGRPCDPSSAFTEINWEYFIEGKTLGQILWQPSVNGAKMQCIIIIIIIAIIII